MRKILIDAMMIKRQNTGLGVYACEVLSRLLPKLIDKYEVTVLCTDKALIEKTIGLDNIQYIEISVDNAFKRELSVGRYVYKHREYDLFYSLSQHGFPWLKMKEIITVHDIMPRLYPKGRIHQYLYYIMFLPLVINSLRCVITVSESTARDIKKFYSCPNVEVVYNGTSLPNYKKSSTPWHSTHRKQYVTVGVHYPYKNLHTLIELFIKDERFSNRELVIIGNSDNTYGRQLKEQVQKANAWGQIKFTGYISDIEKQEYINSSYAMIYPSKYEGFGLPVLESMAQGIPVACSNSSSLPEVAGNAAVMFDPEDLNDMAEKILMLDDESLCHQLIARGFENIKLFTWEECANKIMGVIEDVLK